MTRSEFVHLALIGYPRSRGVYTTIYEMAGGPYGSSPLARGLLVADPHQDQAPGIIPARAGFTGHCLLSDRLVGDHPRSRGVYDVLEIGLPHVEGSSPLARGLLVPFGWGGWDGGIIPARAGFTNRPRACTGSTGDHPRSRGVYFSRRSICASTCGSSPLARGLRDLGLLVAADRGIIPARAGFTAAKPPPLAGRGDHPRSRGVYMDNKCVCTFIGGSSPLARGLRARMLVHQRMCGIIPARAGFTRNPSW